MKKIIKHNYVFYVCTQVLSVAKAHLDLVTQERSVYRDELASQAAAVSFSSILLRVLGCMYLW